MGEVSIYDLNKLEAKAFRYSPKTKTTRDSPHIYFPLTIKRHINQKSSRPFYCLSVNGRKKLEPILNDSGERWGIPWAGLLTQRRTNVHTRIYTYEEFRVAS